MYGSTSRLAREQFHFGLGEADPDNPNDPDEVFSGLTLIPGVVWHDFYRLFQRTMLEQGYEVGRSLYLWAYDWRRSAVTLAGRLEALLDRIGEPVHVIAHSTGGLILDCYLRYGAVPLEQAREPRFETASRFASCTWVGVLMRGGIVAVRDMFKGYRPAPGGLRFPPAATVTFPAVYEAFPFDGRVLRAPSGETLDLYDPELWRRHGWPLSRRGDLRLMRRFHGPDFSLERHVATRLQQAQLFHEALLRGPAWPPGRHWIVANDRIPTAATVPLRRVQGSLFPVFPQYSDDVADHFVDGDMTATLASALRGTERESIPSNVSISFYDCRHRYLVSHLPVIEDLLTHVKVSSGN